MASFRRWDIKKKMSDPRNQFVIGLIMNVTYLIILISSQTSNSNLRPAEDEFKDNLWNGTDVATYVQPARNFNLTGVFGTDLIPDYHRTIGYPLLLSVAMEITHTHWFWLIYVFQALLGALVAPLLTIVSSNFTKLQSPHAIVTFAALLILFPYGAYLPTLLTDHCFSSLLIIGICIGVIAIKTDNFWLLFLHIVCIGIAAQIRPSLIGYPLINIFVLWTAAQSAQKTFKQVWLHLVISTIILTVLCFGPSIRNYINYNHFVATDIVGNNLFDYVAKDVLVEQGLYSRYQDLNRELETIGDWAIRDVEKQRISFKIFQEYPMTTFKRVLTNARVNLFTSHWVIVAHYWGKNYKGVADPNNSQMPLLKSTIVQTIWIFGYFIYAFIYFLFISFLLRLLKSQKILEFVCILGFIGYLMIPSLTSADPRFRLPIEAIVVIIAMYELFTNVRISNLLKTNKEVIKSSI